MTQITNQSFDFKVSENGVKTLQTTKQFAHDPCSKSNALPTVN